MLATQRPKLVPWLPTFAYMCLIWIVSSFERLSVPIESIPLRDKGAHVAEYAVLGALGYWSCIKTWPHVRKSLLVVVAASIAIAWGLLDEIHQAFVPGRMSDIRDWAADIVGGLSGTMIAMVLDRLRNRCERNSVSGRGAHLC